MIKFILSLSFASLLCWPGGARAAETDPDWEMKARKALLEKIAEINAQRRKADTNQASATTVADDFRQVPQVNGILIVGSPKDFNPDGLPLISGLSITNLPLLQTRNFTNLVGRFIGQPLSEANMRALQTEIILYYRKHDRPLVDVLYPEQIVNNGMLQVIVIEGRLKEVKLQDKSGKPYTNGWSGVQYLRDNIHLRTNEPISEAQLAKDLDWINRNPFRSAQAIYEPDQREYGLSSVLLRIDEQRQWSAGELLVGVDLLWWWRRHR